MEDLKRQIEDIRQLLSKKDSEITELKSAVLLMADTIKQHQHSGSDGSAQIESEPVVLKDNVRFQTGLTSIDSSTLKSESGEKISYTAIITGGEAGKKGRVDTLKDSNQFTVEYNHDTDTAFIYSFTNPLYVGTGSVTSGQPELKQNEFTFSVNELAGKFIYVVVNDSKYGYQILSNTNNTITISGTFSGSDNNASFIVYMPAYMGASNYPFRRLYTTGSTDGGVRFGLGATNNGQNGLLYLEESTGRLQFRRPNGTIDTV